MKHIYTLDLPDRSFDSLMLMAARKAVESGPIAPQVFATVMEGIHKDYAKNLCHDRFEELVAECEKDQPELAEKNAKTLRESLSTHGIPEEVCNVIDARFSTVHTVLNMRIILRCLEDLGKLLCEAVKDMGNLTPDSTAEFLEGVADGFKDRFKYVFPGSFYSFAVVGEHNDGKNCMFFVRPYYQVALRLPSLGVVVDFDKEGKPTDVVSAYANADQMDETLNHLYSMTPEDQRSEFFRDVFQAQRRPE